MLQGILAIAGWFTRGGAIASLLTWFGVKFTSKAAILSAQIASISLLFASRAAFLWLFLKSQNSLLIRFHISSLCFLRGLIQIRL